MARGTLDQARATIIFLLFVSLSALWDPASIKREGRILFDPPFYIYISPFLEYNFPIESVFFFSYIPLRVKISRNTCIFSFFL